MEPPPNGDVNFVCFNLEKSYCSREQIQLCGGSAGYVGKSNQVTFHTTRKLKRRCGNFPILLVLKKSIALRYKRFHSAIYKHSPDTNSIVVLSLFIRVLSLLGIHSSRTGTGSEGWEGRLYLQFLSRESLNKPISLLSLLLLSTAGRVSKNRFYSWSF